MNPKLRPGTNHCLCAECGEYFTTPSNFDLHRAGNAQNRRCVYPGDTSLPKRGKRVYGVTRRVSGQVRAEFTVVPHRFSLVLACCAVVLIAFALISMCSTARRAALLSEADARQEQQLRWQQHRAECAAMWPLKREHYAECLQRFDTN